MRPKGNVSRGRGGRRNGRKRRKKSAVPGEPSGVRRHKGEKVRASMARRRAQSRKVLAIEINGNLVEIRRVGLTDYVNTKPAQELKAITDFHDENYIFYRVGQDVYYLDPDGILREYVPGE